MFTQQDTSYLTPSWSTDTMSMSQYGNTWDTTQNTTWGDDDVDVNNFFSLPSAIDDLSSSIIDDSSPVEPHQSIADFYWSLAASTSSAPGSLGPTKSVSPPIPNQPTTRQSVPYTAPPSPPEHFSTAESGRSSPVVGNAESGPALSPVSTSSVSAGGAPASTKPSNKKMLRTSTRKPKSESEQQKKARPTPAPNTKEAKLQRAKNCHNLVEKKYRNRLNNNFELLLNTVTELRKQGAVGSVAGDEMGMGGGMDLYDDDNESLSSKGGGEKDSRSMSKSDVLRLARETVLDLERKNRALVSEVERLKALRGVTGPTGYC